uniref:Ubiquitin-like protease family profile domain-containing protein n=1 Tax=Cucumis melo TaxID=3656 RepID=A0A9I9D209_CUCME
MVIEQEKPTNTPLKIDWGKVWARKDDDPIPDLLITTTTSKMDSDWEHSSREELLKLSDGELEDKIRRMTNLLKTSCYRLPDKGEKLRRCIELAEEERESRKLRRIEKEATGCENLSQPTTSSIVARERIASSSADSVCAFTARFNQKLEQKTERNNSAFGEELSILGHCDNRRQRSNGKLSPKVKQKGQTSSRQQPFKCVNSLSTDVHQKVSSVAAQNSKRSDHIDFHVSEWQPECFGKKDDSEVQHSDTPMPQKRQTIVVVDEEEALAMKIPKHDDKCMKEAKIYYPSRDDPESVEICFEDIKCLDPEGFHFPSAPNFSSYAGIYNNEHFPQISLHWSLVIICFPQKDDESRPIILHLDSLRLHSSRSIFDNIKSFVKEEWCYLDREVADSDLPMPYRLWKNISRRIEEKIIEVPQQKNDCDCGLFVLYFIERFIEEAPDRLKRKDLDMFGKRWFKPQEASSLRTKIRCLLKVEFQNEKKRCLPDPVGSSSSDHAPKQ